MERFEDESGNQCFIATIKATPAPCFAQWNKKSNEEDEFNPINVIAEEFRGTSNNLPYPKLAVKDRNLLESNSFQIEVSNVVGSTFKKISGKRPIFMKHPINNDIVPNININEICIYIK